MSQHFQTSPRSTDSGVVYVDGSDGLSLRGRFVAWILALGILLTLGIGLAMADNLPFSSQRVAGTPASNGIGEPEDADRTIFEGTTTRGGEAQALKVIDASWDGKVVNLDWDGNRYVRAESTFLGNPVLSPGDRVQSTLKFRNAGPSDAVTSVKIHVDQEQWAKTENTDLAENVTLFWKLGEIQGEEKFSDLLANGGDELLQMAIAKDASEELMMGVSMDRGVTAARNAGERSTELTLDVYLEMSGDTTAPKQPIPAELPHTGVSGLGYVLLAAAALLLLGLLFLLLKRRGRRYCDQCEQEIDKDDRWVEVRDAHGIDQCLCMPCFVENHPNAAVEHTGTSSDGAR